MKGALKLLKVLKRKKIKMAIQSGEVSDSTRSLSSFLDRIDRTPKHKQSIHPATLVFQALRIAVNDELRNLDTFLKEILLKCNQSARVAIISFHSLEDRIVKNKFNELASNNLPKWVVSTDSKKEYRIIAKKVRASIEEVSKNKRSKSGIMRCLERI
jgi:16S rRNA (cytosine1402-N4)-methyltransferase